MAVITLRVSLALRISFDFVQSPRKRPGVCLCTKGEQGWHTIV